MADKHRKQPPLFEFENETPRETLLAREHMRFECELIRQEEQLEFWDINHFKPNGGEERASGSVNANSGRSADWMRYASGPCELYICYFTFDEEPCIAVPIYINGQVAMAQGIVRFPLVRTPNAGPLGCLLLAAVARHFALSREFQLRWLFLSPINHFRNSVLEFLTTYRIHFSDQGTRCVDLSRCNYRPNEIWLQKGEEDPELYANHYYIDTKPFQDKRNESAWPATRFDLGILCGDVYTSWDVVNQRWKKTPPSRDIQYVQKLRDATPYAFLMGLCGDGILIVDALSLAEYASVPHFMGDIPNTIDSRTAWEYS